MPKKVTDNEPNRADEYVQKAAKLVSSDLPRAINLYYLAAGLYRSEGLTDEAEEAEWMAKEYGKKRATDELLPVPVNDALSDRAKLERRRDIEAALAHSESIGSRAEELAYRKSVSRSKETQAAGERLYKAIQAARAKLVAEYKELGGDVSRVSDEELKPVPVGDEKPTIGWVVVSGKKEVSAVYSTRDKAENALQAIKREGRLKGSLTVEPAHTFGREVQDRRTQLHQALDRMLGKDADYDAKQVDERRRKVFKEAERMYYAADPSASGFPYAPASVRKEWIDKAKKKLGLESIPAKDLLSTAQDQEIAQDRKRALDSYRKAASAFRSTGDSKQEAVAREGIDECQRKLVGGVDSTYSHPSSGKVQAFDAADRALTSAIQRTRAGERVRMARDSATGETVVEPARK